MAQFSSTIDVAASADDAFAFLRDPMNRAEWDPSVRSITPIAAASGEVGDRYTVTVGFYGKAIEVTYEIAEIEAPRRVVFVTDGAVSGRDVIEIVGTGTGSVVSLDLTVHLGGMARLLDRGLQVAFAGIGENAAAGVRKKLSA